MSLTKVRASTLDLSGVSGIGGGVGVNVLTIAGVDNTGVTDSTPYLQAYVNALTIPTTLYFPAGTYTVQNLVLTGKIVSLTGESRYVSFLQRLGGDVTYKSMVYPGQGTKINGLTFNYNWSGAIDGAPNGSTGGCIYCYNINKLIITDCEFDNAKFCAVNFAADYANPPSAQNIQIRNNSFAPGGIALYANKLSYGSAVTGNYILSGSSTNYIVNLTNCTDTVFKDNFVQDFSTLLGVNITGCTRVIASNNLVTNGAGVGISLTNCASCIVSDNTVTTPNTFTAINLIANNTFCEILGNIIPGCLNGVQVSTGCTNITIANNTIQSAGQYGVYIDNAGNNNPYITINGNNIAKTQKAGIAVLSGDIGYIISNNIISDPNMAAQATAPVNSGIYTIALVGNIITGNSIVGSNIAGHGYPTYGVFTSCITVNGVVSGNTTAYFRVANYSLGTCVTTGNV